MNKIIIIGYADQSGLTGAKIIGGPGLTTEDESLVIIERARDRHEFPKGIQRVELYAVAEPDDVYTFISEDAAKTIQGNFQQTLRLQAARQAQEDAARAAQKNFTAAHNVFQAAARKRNEALGAVAVHRNLLSADGLDAKAKAAAQAKVDELQPKADAAVAEFAEVLKQFDIVRNPKARPEEITAALVALKVIEAPKK